MRMQNDWFADLRLKLYQQGVVVEYERAREWFIAFRGTYYFMVLPTYAGGDIDIEKVNLPSSRRTVYTSRGRRILSTYTTVYRILRVLLEEPIDYSVELDGYYGFLL